MGLTLLWVDHIAARGLRKLLEADEQDDHEGQNYGGGPDDRWLHAGMPEDRMAEQGLLDRARTETMNFSPFQWASNSVHCLP